jgi:hypothetical protein
LLFLTTKEGLASCTCDNLVALLTVCCVSEVGCSLMKVSCWKKKREFILENFSILCSMEPV